MSLTLALWPAIAACVTALSAVAGFLAWLINLVVSRAVNAAFREFLADLLAKHIQTCPVRSGLDARLDANEKSLNRLAERADARTAQYEQLHAEHGVTDKRLDHLEATVQAHASELAELHSLVADA